MYVKSQTSLIVGVLTYKWEDELLFQLNTAPQNMPNYPLAAYGITKKDFQLRSPRLHTKMTGKIDLAIRLVSQRALMTPVTCPDTKFIGIACTFIQRQVAPENLVALDFMPRKA